MKGSEKIRLPFAGAENRKLRVALLSSEQEKHEPWIIRLIQRLQGSDKIELSGIVVSDQNSEPVESNPFFDAMYDLEAKLTSKKFANEDGEGGGNPADIPVCKISDEPALEELRADVVIDVSRSLGRAVSPELFPFGVWYLDFLAPFAGGPAFDAVTSSAPVTTIHLRAHISGSAEPVQISSAILNTKFLAVRNFLIALEKSVVLIERELHRIRLRGEMVAEPVDQPTHVQVPQLGQVTKYIFSVGVGLAKRLTEKIGIKLGLRPGMFFLKFEAASPLAINPKRMTNHFAKENEYYADPFLWERDGRMYCFLEVYDYKSGHGHIGVAEMSNGDIGEIKTALKCDYHLSFPFLFERHGELMMMPETCAARTVETWRCVEFPDKWERDRTIMDNVEAADCNVAQIGDEWWLFANIATDPSGDMSPELHLFRADGPELTNLVPHPLNPVVFDSTTARNGGRVIEHEGRLLRMSQDNSHGLYGYGVNIMEIEHISMDDYREKLVRKIEPDKRDAQIGAHHFDYRGGVSIIDVRKRIGGR